LIWDKYPDISLVVDDQDSPYGVVDSKDGDGYLKPTHLPSRPVVIQQQGIIVATFVAEVLSSLPLLLLPLKLN
jgi:hypothetical protein